MARTCLLIMPQTFYSLARVIHAGLVARGFDVTSANDEYPNNTLGKILGKLDSPLIRWLTRREFQRRFLGQDWDMVVIIKGRGIGPELAADLRSRCPWVVGYHFDALAYDKGTQRWVDHVDRVTTFDYADAAAHDWPVVELFSSFPMSKTPPPIRYRWSAIMRNHTDRLAYVEEIANIMGQDRAFIHMYEQNIVTFIYNMIRNPLRYWRWRNKISFQPLAYADYVDVIATSDFTLDYVHPKQSGLSIRCFEARASGTKLITSNANIGQSETFENGLAILHRMGSRPDTLRQTAALYAGQRPTAKLRSLQDFISEIIGNNGEPPAARRGLSG
jgi:hypothetical protein